jgi:hypothetical protein
MQPRLAAAHCCHTKPELAQLDHQELTKPFLWTVYCKYQESLSREKNVLSPHEPCRLWMYEL